MSSVTGANDITAAFANLEARAVKEVKEIIELNIGDMAEEARRNAPGSGDMIATQGGSIKFDDIKSNRGFTPISQAITYKIENGGLKGSVTVEISAGEVAAYVEFGTGQSAASYLLTVPTEWREIARKYYVNGKGTIIAAPFLLPAFMKYSVKAVKELKEFLATLRL